MDEEEAAAEEEAASPGLLAEEVIHAPRAPTHAVRRRQLLTPIELRFSPIQFLLSATELLLPPFRRLFASIGRQRFVRPVIGDNGSLFWRRRPSSSDVGNFLGIAGSF